MARVLLFGKLADIAGWREREIDAACEKQQQSRQEYFHDPLSPYGRRGHSLAGSAAFALCAEILTRSSVAPRILSPPFLEKLAL